MAGTKSGFWPQITVGMQRRFRPDGLLQPVSYANLRITMTVMLVGTMPSLIGRIDPKRCEDSDYAVEG